MQIAVIDLGTNSVRFDIQQWDTKRPIRLYREKVMVKLGEGVFLRGRLDVQAKKRTLRAFLKFHRVMRRLKVDQVMAFGTSALRESRDSKEFLRLLQKKTGIRIRIISGKEEARLIALGILAHERIPSKKFALVDIGGGSTEISLCQKREMLEGDSLRLGTARLQQLFLQKIPPSPQKIFQLRGLAWRELREMRPNYSWPQVSRIIGSSGTIRSLARMLQKKPDRKKVGRKKTIDLKDLSKLIERMSSMSRSQLLRVPQMEKKRVDSILGGAILLEECMLALGARKLTTTEYTLRDGILAEAIRKFA